MKKNCLAILSHDFCLQTEDCAPGTSMGRNSESRYKNPKILLEAEGKGREEGGSEEADILSVCKMKTRCLISILGHGMAVSES